MNKVRVGILGCAAIARRQVIPALRRLPDLFQIVAIASRTDEKAQEFASEFGMEAVIGYDNLIDRSDIDALYIPLPTGLHEEYVTKAIRAGKHVLAEKSFAMDFNSASAMVELAREKGVLLMEDFMFLYHGQHRFPWEQLKSGELGEFRLFRSQFGFPPLDRGNFRYQMSLGGGALLDAGAYTLRAAQWFLGDQLSVDSAMLASEPGLNVDVYGSATLYNSKEQVAQISFGFDNAYQCNYEIWGSRAKLTAQKAFTPKSGEPTEMFVESNSRRETHVCEPDDHFMNILKEFYESIIFMRLEKHHKDIISQARLLSLIKQIASKR